MWAGIVKAVVPGNLLSIRQTMFFSPTLRVNLRNDRSRIPLLAALDSCCQSCYMCATIKTSTISSGKYIIYIQEYCRIEIESIHNGDKELSITARVQKMRGIRTPVPSVDDIILKSFEGLQLTDPNFNHSGRVSLVLGLETVPLIMTGRIQNDPGLSLAEYTTFGWIISDLSPFYNSLLLYK